MSTLFPVCPRKRTSLPILELLPPPVLGERRHRSLARRLVAVRRRAILMMSKGQRPHPRRALRCRVHLHDAADDGGIGEHIVNRRRSTRQTGGLLTRAANRRLRAATETGCPCAGSCRR